MRDATPAEVARLNSRLLRPRSPASKLTPLDRPVRGRYAIFVWNAMLEEGISGDPRNFVIVSGSDVITHKRAYVVTSLSNGEPVDVRNHDGDGKPGEILTRTVVHRSKLHEILDYEFERAFWRRGRRTLR